MLTRQVLCRLSYSGANFAFSIGVWAQQLPTLAIHRTRERTTVPAVLHVLLLEGAAGTARDHMMLCTDDLIRVSAGC